MNKLLLPSILLISGAFLTGCYHKEQMNTQTASSQMSSDNAAYQSGHSSKLGKLHKRNYY